MSESAIFGRRLGEQVERIRPDQGLKMSCGDSEYYGLTCINVLLAWAGSIFTKKDEKIMSCGRMRLKICSERVEVSNRTYSNC